MTLLKLDSANSHASKKKQEKWDYTKNSQVELTEAKQAIIKMHKKVIPDGYFQYPIPEIHAWILVKESERDLAEIKAQEFLMKYKDARNRFYAETKADIKIKS